MRDGRHNVFWKWTGSYSRSQWVPSGGIAPLESHPPGGNKTSPGPVRAGAFEWYDLGGAPMRYNKAREFIRRGRYDAARVELERLLQGEDCSLSERAEAHRLVASVCYKLKDLYAAKSHAEEALRLAKATRSKHLAAEAHFVLGIALTELGDPPEAMLHLQTFLERQADSASGERLEPKALFAIAQNLYRSQQYADAVSQYQQAATLFEKRGPQNLQAWCWRNIFDCCLFLHRPHAALPYLNQLSDYTLTNPGDLYIRNALLVDKAHYCRVTGNLPVSMDFCRQLFEPGRPGVTDTHRTEAAWIAGLNALDLGDPQHAKMFADLALESAIKAKWPLAINRATKLRVAITENIASAEERRSLTAEADSNTNLALEDRYADQPKLGERLRKLRHARRLTQVQLARLADISPSYLSRLETGDQATPPAHTLQALLRVLGHGDPP